MTAFTPTPELRAFIDSLLETEIPFDRDGNSVTVYTRNADEADLICELSEVTGFTDWSAGVPQADQPAPFNPYDDPEYADAERQAEQQAWMREQAAMQPGWHHPDCQCNECYYGQDLARWAFHASEY